MPMAVHFGTAGVVGAWLVGAAAGEVTTTVGGAVVVGAAAGGAVVTAGVGVALAEVVAAVVVFLLGPGDALAWFLPGNTLQASQRTSTASTPARARRRQ